MSKISEFPVVTTPTETTHYLAGVSESGGVFTNFRTTLANALKRIQVATETQLGGVKVGGASAGDVFDTAYLASNGGLRLSLDSGSGLFNSGGSLGINRSTLNGYKEMFVSIDCDDTAPVLTVLYNSGFQTASPVLTRLVSGVYNIEFNASSLDEFPLASLLVFHSSTNPKYGISFSNFYGSPPPAPYITNDVVITVNELYLSAGPVLSVQTIDDTAVNPTIYLRIIVLD
jgi:predicted RNase H-like HicB family nuclease